MRMFTKIYQVILHSIGINMTNSVTINQIMFVVLKHLKETKGRESYLGCVVSVVFVHGDSTAANSTEGLAQRLLNGLHSRQRSLQGYLVTGVKSAPTGGDSHQE